MIADITVVIPTLPTRSHMLKRALLSVDSQTIRPTNIITKYDTRREGAPITRQRGLDEVSSKWVAFLDDDDEFKPFHLEALLTAAMSENADYVFSWYDVIGGIDPRADEFGLPWDPASPRQTTITTLVRADLARDVGGFVTEGDDLHHPDRRYAGEDWLFTNRINNAGGVIYHLPERTWYWHHHSSNTSGLPTRGH